MDSWTWWSGAYGDRAGLRAYHALGPYSKGILFVGVPSTRHHSAFRDNVPRSPSTSGAEAIGPSPRSVRGQGPTMATVDMRGIRRQSTPTGYRMSNKTVGGDQTRPPGSGQIGKAFTFHRVRGSIYLAVATGNLSASSNCPVRWSSTMRKC